MFTCLLLHAQWDALGFVQKQLFHGYVNCASHTHAVDEFEPLPLQQVLQIALDVAKGLDQLHSLRILSEDIKPVSLSVNALSNLSLCVPKARLTGNCVVAFQTDERLCQL